MARKESDRLCTGQIWVWGMTPFVVEKGVGWYVMKRASLVSVRGFMRTTVTRIFRRVRESKGQLYLLYFRCTVVPQERMHAP